MIGSMDTPKSTSIGRTPTDREIPRLLATLAASGDSLAAFARARGLSTWKLYKAQRKSGRRADSRPLLDPIRIVPDVTNGSVIELEHSSGHTLRVPSGFDAGTLRRLIEVLESC